MRRASVAMKKGDGLLMVYSDVAAEHKEEFNRWYNFPLETPVWH